VEAVDRTEETLFRWPHGSETPYHQKPILRLCYSKRQRMARKSSLRGKAKNPCHKTRKEGSFAWVGNYRANSNQRAVGSIASRSRPALRSCEPELRTGIAA
jgi:hypothetical protein